MGPRYSDTQKQEILAYANQYGIPRAAEKFNIYASTIRRWSATRKKQREFTEAQRNEILAYASKYGVKAAANKYDVRDTTITYWNKTRAAYQSQVYDENMIMKILTFARDNGVMAAAREFNVSKFTITRWNKTRHVYSGRRNVKYTKYTPAQQIEILHVARRMYDEMDTDVRSANHVFNLMAEKYNVTVDQLRGWNTKHRIVPGRYSRSKPITRDEIKVAQRALNESRGRIAAAARKSGLSHDRIAQMVRTKQIAFKQGEVKIKSDMRIGPNKRRVIGEILGGLLRAKSK